MLGFIAFLLTKLPASESTGKQAFWYSKVKTSNADNEARQSLRCSTPDMDISCNYVTWRVLRILKHA